MLRLLIAALWIWGCPAFAFKASRVSCTSVNAKLDIVPMKVTIQVAGGVTKTLETPFHFWVAPNRYVANRIEKDLPDTSAVLIMSQPKFKWQVADGEFDIDLTRTFKGEIYNENRGQEMYLSTDTLEFMAGIKGWIFSCNVVDQY